MTNNLKKVDTNYNTVAIIGRAGLGKSKYLSGNENI
jgi:hypothetical protein